LALAIPLLVQFIPNKPHIRTISLKAKKYGYTPGRIVVDKGDTVILKPTSLDVTHGFLLDGYPVDAILKQQGVTLLK
jgi:heme/copper-type cytochrome/quinol oxidase subunit 2